MDNWLSVNEAAEKLGVSPRTIRRYIKKGEVEFKSVRGRRRQEYRVAESSLDKIFKRQGFNHTPGNARTATMSADAVPKFLYDEIREENKKLFLQVNRLNRELEEIKQSGTMVSEDNKDKEIAFLKQELSEKENLIQLLETTIASLKK